MKKILTGLLFLWALGVQASDTLTISVNKKTPQFMVTLPSNPTTGFQWTVTSYDKKILQLKSSHFVAPQTKLIGAGGQMTFTFAPIKGKSYPDTTKMTFSYARSWEANSGTLKQVVVNFSK